MDFTALCDRLSPLKFHAVGEQSVVGCFLDALNVIRNHYSLGIMPDMYISIFIKLYKMAIDTNAIHVSC